MAKLGLSPIFWLLVLKYFLCNMGWAHSVIIPFAQAEKGLKKKKVKALEPGSSSSKPGGLFLWFWWPRAIWIITRLSWWDPAILWQFSKTMLERVSIVYSQFPNHVSNQAGLVWVFSWQLEWFLTFTSQVHAREQGATPFPLSFYICCKLSMLWDQEAVRHPRDITELSLAQCFPAHRDWGTWHNNYGTITLWAS